jgi:preprotein translocase subunit SecB
MADNSEIPPKSATVVLANDLVCCDEVMTPFAREILAQLCESGEPIPLILDQTKASDRHQILMLSVRWVGL